MANRHGRVLVSRHGGFPSPASPRRFSSLPAARQPCIAMADRRWMAETAAAGRRGESPLSFSTPIAVIRLPRRPVWLFFRSCRNLCLLREMGKQLTRWAWRAKDGRTAGVGCDEKRLCRLSGGMLRGTGVYRPSWPRLQYVWRRAAGNGRVPTPLPKAANCPGGTLDNPAEVCYNNHALRSWRNWHTRTFEGRIRNRVRVQVPSTAPWRVFL